MTPPLDGSAGERDAFLAMAREFPVRTVILSLGLPLFAVVQVVNASVSRAPVLFVGLFALLTIVFSVRLTQYQVAVYRRRRVTEPRA